MSVHYRAVGAAIIVFGNTYPLRERIKALGGRYNGPDKNWRLPLNDQNLSLVEELCRSCGGGALAAPSTPPRTGGAVRADGDDIDAVAEVSIAPVAEPDAGDLRGSERTAVAKPAGLSVRELVDRAAAAIQQAFPSSVWVVGEVQNAARKPSGIYFDLAEARGNGHSSATLTVRAVLWPQSLQELAARHGSQAVFDVLQDGMQIRCACRVQFYRDRSALSLVVEDLDPTFTKGALALAREKLLKELRAKGLDQANKRRPLPAFPFRVGLISAERSRAAADFLDQLEQGGFPGEVLFLPTPMQGDAVPQLVVQALSRLARAACDLIVLTRGGGSAADLRWFDAPEIAYAVAACPVPVIAAIGHHDDVCVAEEICHRRQKTPTAAADCVLEIFRQTRERIDRLAHAGATALDTRIDRATQIQSYLAERLALRSQESLARRHESLLARGRDLERMATTAFSCMTQVLLQRHAGLDAVAQARLGHAELTLSQLEGHLGRKDPAPWIAQGWTRLATALGAARRRADLRLGELVRARLSDAVVELRVERLVDRSDNHPKQHKKPHHDNAAITPHGSPT